MAGGVAEAAPLDPASLCALNTGTSTASSATTTTLIAAPSSGLPEGIPVVLVALVTPCAAKGTVQFQDGTATIGAPVTITGGLAFTIAPTLTAGSHSLTAKFTPADSPFDSSTSTAVPLTVLPPITVNIPLFQFFLKGQLFSPDPARFIEFLHGGHPAAPTG